MTEIHAFDPDGTPSPGAQTALDAAVAAIPDASAEARGMMTDTAAGAIADLPSALTATEDAAIAASRVPATFTYGTTGGRRYSHFRTFAGRPTPGLVTKRFATTDSQGTGTGLVPVRETLSSFAKRTGSPVLFNASGWKVSGNVGEMRGAQIRDGQVFHDFEDFDASPAGIDAIGFRADGTVGLYSKRWGDTAASMVEDGVVDSFSYGPVLVRDGVSQQLSDPRWAYFITEVSSRQIIGVNALGDFMATTVEGKSGESGLTGPECITLAASLGYHHAVLMDGGGSAQAQAGGIRVLPSSDEAGERAVPDALGVNAALIDPEIDTGWVDCVMGEGFVAHNGTPPQVRRIGSVVYMRRGVSNTGIAANSGPEGVFTVPAAFRPNGWRYVIVTGSTVSNGGLAVVRDGGRVQVRTGPTLSPYYVFETAFWPLG